MDTYREVWAEVFNEHGLQFGDRVRVPVVRLTPPGNYEALEGINRDAAESFIEDHGDKCRLWLRLRDEAGLTEEPLDPTQLSTQDSDGIRKSVELEISERTRRHIRKNDGTLSKLYQDHILRIEERIISATESLAESSDSPPYVSRVLQSQKNDLELEHKALQTANAARLAWEKSDQFEPPPEINEMGHIDGLAAPWRPDEDDFSLNIEEDEGTFRGSVEGLGAVIGSLTTTVAALVEWSELQAERTRQSNVELRELIEQRTTASLVNSRNAWMYDKACQGQSYGQIRMELDSVADERGWRKFTSNEGVRKAVLKYADVAFLARPAN